MPPKNDPAKNHRQPLFQLLRPMNRFPMTATSLHCLSLSMFVTAAKCDENPIEMLDVVAENTDVNFEEDSPAEHSFVPPTENTPSFDLEPILSRLAIYVMRKRKLKKKLEKEKLEKEKEKDIPKTEITEHQMEIEDEYIRLIDAALKNLAGEFKELAKSLWATFVSDVSIAYRKENTAGIPEEIEKEEQLWTNIFKDHHLDPLKTKVFRNLRRYATSHKQETFDLLSRNDDDDFANLEYFADFFRKQFLLENEYTNFPEKFLSLEDEIDYPFPFCIAKLRKSQVLKQRRLQSVIFCSFEVDTSLYISNRNHFPLLTSIKATQGGALSETIYFKMVKLNYRILEKEFGVSAQATYPLDLSPTINKVLRNVGLSSQQDFSRADILALQLCELLYYVEVARWPGALIHNTMFLDLYKKEANVSLTHLPMALPGVMNDVILALRASVENSNDDIKKLKKDWIYDYREGVNANTIGDIYNTPKFQKSLISRVYFQGAELRLFVLWQHRCLRNLLNLGPDEDFLVRIWPTLFGFFREEIEEKGEADEKQKKAEYFSNFLPTKMRKLENIPFPDLKQRMKDSPEEIEEEENFEELINRGTLIDNLGDFYRNDQVYQSIIQYIERHRRDFASKLSCFELLCEILILWFAPKLQTLVNQHNQTFLNDDRIKHTLQKRAERCNIYYKSESASAGFYKPTSSVILEDHNSLHNTQGYQKGNKQIENIFYQTVYSPYQKFSRGIQKFGDTDYM